VPGSPPPPSQSDEWRVALPPKGDILLEAVFRGALTSHVGEAAGSDGVAGRRPRLGRLVTIGISALVCIGPAVSVANPAVTGSGRLAGRTQISFGCPGPVSEGTPGCNPWRPFAHARFSIAQRASRGDPILGIRRAVSSDARARFALRLPVGTYLITPLPQRHTHGGTPVIVHVRAGQSTTTLVRFDGFPQME
jgi:hypothetical protein